MLKGTLKRLAAGTVVYGIGAVLQRFIGFGLLPFFTSELAPEDYGVMALISLVAVLLTGIFNLGTGNSMSLLYSRQENISDKKTIVWTSVILLLLNSLICFGIVYLLAPKISFLIFQTDSYSQLIRISVVGLVFTTISEPFLAYLRLEEKGRKFVIITSTAVLITSLISIYLVLFQKTGLIGLIAAGSIGQLFLLFLILTTVGREIKFSLNFKLFKPLVRIGFPSIFGLFAFLLIDYADRQMIERIMNVEALGIYSIGYSFGMVMLIFISAFGSAWPPFFMSFVDKKKEAIEVFPRVMTYYLLGFSMLVVASFFFSRPITFLLTAPEFHNAYLVVGIISAAYMFKGCYLIALPGIYFANKLYLQSLIEWVAAILNVTLNVLFISKYGLTGAAMATLISYLTLPLLAGMAARKYLKVDYEWKRNILTVLISFIFSFLILEVYKEFDDNYFGIGMSTVLLFSYLYITYQWLINKYEKSIAISWIKEKWR